MRARGGAHSRGWLGLVAAFLAGTLFAAWFWRRQVREVAAKAGRYARRRSTVRRPVLIINRWSGDGKAGRYGLLNAAERLGIETVVLERGDDLSQLARDAVARGADALGMAGGDGSLGLVAAVAIDHDLPFFCVPVGTRNHFALDLGLDRDDPLAALEAIIDGDELRIDHGLVGERVFLNNVSFGVYAEAVQKDEYRGAKVATILQTARGGAESEGGGPDVRVATPDGHVYETAPVLLISNNVYVFNGPPDFGRRERLDAGVLGIGAMIDPASSDAGSALALAPGAGLREWTATSFRVDASGTTVRAGVDGEALEVPAPVVLRIRPKELRVLVPSGTRPGYISRSQQAAVELFDLVSLAGEPEPSDG